MHLFKNSFGAVSSAAMAVSLLATNIALVTADGDGTGGDTVNQCITSRGICWRNLTDTSVDWCIDTIWHINYHKKLRQKILAIDGYGPIDWSVYDHCGWNRAVGISAKQVDRGVIYYKAPGNSSLSFYPTFVPPRIRGATSTLYNTYPVNEILAIVLTVLGVFVVLPITLCFTVPIIKGIKWVGATIMAYLRAIFTAPRDMARALKRRRHNRKVAKAQRLNEKGVREDYKSWKSDTSDSTMCEKV